QGDQADDGQRADHRGHRAAIAWHRVIHALSSRSPRIVGRHRDVTAGLVEKEHPRWVEVGLALSELLAQFLDAGALSLGGGQCLFLRVSFKRASARCTADVLHAFDVRYPKSI